MDYRVAVGLYDGVAARVPQGFSCSDEFSSSHCVLFLSKGARPLSRVSKLIIVQLAIFHQWSWVFRCCYGEAPAYYPE